MKKNRLLIFTIILCLISLTINSDFLNIAFSNITNLSPSNMLSSNKLTAQFANNIKISDSQGLTRAFRANINQNMKVVIACDGQIDESEINLVNSENGLNKSASSATKKSSVTEIVFSDVSSGNWIIQLSNKTIKINNVGFR